MKFLQFVKGMFTRNIPLKLIALALAIVCAIVATAAGAIV